jgi:hypothetical protein
MTHGEQIASLKDELLIPEVRSGAATPVRALLHLVIFYITSTLARRPESY